MTRLANGKGRKVLRLVAVGKFMGSREIHRKERQTCDINLQSSTVKPSSIRQRTDLENHHP